MIGEGKQKISKYFPTHSLQKSGCSGSAKGVITDSLKTRGSAKAGTRLQSGRRDCRKESGASPPTDASLEVEHSNPCGQPGGRGGPGGRGAEDSFCTRPPKPRPRAPARPRKREDAFKQPWSKANAQDLSPQPGRPFP